MDDIQLVNDKFHQCFVVLLNKYKASIAQEGTDLGKHPLINAIRSIFTRYNPTSMLQPDGLKMVARFYNSDIQLADFLNKLYFSFYMTVGKEEWFRLVQRTAEATSLKAYDAKISTRPMELERYQNAPEDNLELLMNNSYLVIILMIVLTGSDRDVFSE